MKLRSKVIAAVASAVAVAGVGMSTASAANPYAPTWYYANLSGEVSGTADMALNRWYTSTSLQATGLEAATYSYVFNVNMDRNRDGVIEGTQSVNVCTFWGGTGSGYCGENHFFPTGAVMKGSSVELKRLPDSSTGEAVTVASGVFERANN